MADKIVVMNGGNVEQAGPPLELYDRPANLFVAGFIGSPGDEPDPAAASATAASRPRAARSCRCRHGARGSAGIYGIRPEHIHADARRRHAGDGDGGRADRVGDPGHGALGDTPMLCAFRERVTAGPGDTIRIMPGHRRWCICSTAAPAAASATEASKKIRENTGMTHHHPPQRAAARPSAPRRCPRPAPSRPEPSRRAASPPPAPRRPTCRSRSGATPAHAAPGALRRAGRGRLPRQRRQLHQGDRRRGARRLRRLGGHHASRPRSPPIPAPAPTSSSASATRRTSMPTSWSSCPTSPNTSARTTAAGCSLGEKYGKKHGTNNWIGLPFGGTAGPLVYRKSAVNEAGYDTHPERPCRASSSSARQAEDGQQAGRLRARQRGRRRQRLRQLAALVARRLAGRRGGQGRDQQQGDHRRAELPEGAVPDLRAGHAGLGRHQQQPRLCGERAARLTSNGVSLYFSLKNDPATARDRRRHRAFAAAGRPRRRAAPRRAADPERHGVQAQPLPERRQGLPALHDGGRAVRPVADRLPRLLGASAEGLRQQRGLDQRSRRSRSSATA